MTILLNKLPSNSVGVLDSQYDGTGVSKEACGFPTLPSEQSSSGKEPCFRIINHEFRSLQLDTSLAKMSVFDLIDYCAALFEELTHHLHTERGFSSYVRSYMIFNYFVNTFIMIHFNGFAKFMESSHQDFIFYLNLYNFFRLDDILGPNAFDVQLYDLRKWVIQYLTSKDLLSFDVDLLYGWLDDYIEYLKNKDSAEEDQGETEPENSETRYYKTDGSRQYSLSLHLEENGLRMNGAIEELDDLFDFNSRFPEIPLTPAHRATKQKSEVTPYPLNDSALSRGKPPQNHLAIPSPSHHSNGNYPSSFATSGKPSIPQVTPVTASVYRDDTMAKSNPSLSYSFHLQQPQHRIHPASSTSLLSFAPYQHPAPKSSHNGSDLHQSFVGNRNGSMEGNGPWYPHNGNPHMRNQVPNGSMDMSNPFHNSTTFMGPSVPHPPSLPNGTSAFQSLQGQNFNVAPNNYHAQNSDNSKVSWMRRHAVCGLKNLGSSCYINLTVQVLFGLDRFNELFSNSGSKLSQSLQNVRKQPRLTESVANLLSTFNTNGGANIAPTKFLRVLSSLKADFNIPFEQQDAQEFLLFVIDKLHEELAVKCTSDSVEYISKWNITVNPKDKDEYMKWYRGLVGHEGESPINDMFQGHVQSKLICNSCGYKSISYSSFSILSLPIPNANANGVDLTDCLRYYTQDEVLSGENAWNCPKCNKTENKDKDKDNPMDVVFQPKRGMFRFSKRSKSPAKKPTGSSSTIPAQTAISIKQLSFIKLPPVLFIHLSRFLIYNLTDKLNTDIIYPLRLKFNHQTHDIYYSLTGIINHYGNLKSGHYTSLVNKALVNGRRTQDNLQTPSWCFFDDDRIRINVAHGDVNSNESNKLRSRDVYVLCYERI